MAIDTTRTIEIKQSPWRMIGIIAAGGALVATSWFLAIQPQWTVQAIGWFGVLFFGAMLVIAIWRLLTLTGSVITVSPRGVRDTRVASDIVPWSAINGISTWSAYNQPAIVLAVDPAIERTLHLTRLARLTRKANAAVGADGLCIASQGLRMGHDALLETITAYWQRARGDRG